jgi:hypothetical protein
VLFPTAAAKFLFVVNIDTEMHKTAGQCSYVVRTLKSDLLNFTEENVCSELYVETKLAIFISQVFKIITHGIT